MIRLRHDNDGHAFRVFGILVLVMAVPMISSAAVHKSKKQKIQMKPFQNEALHVKLIFPEGWKIHLTDKAVAFYSPYGQPAMRAAMGIMKSSKAKLRIEKAAREEFKTEGKPSEWVQTETTVDHQRAIQVSTPLKSNPAMQRLDYYVESPHGVYYIQCVAPREKKVHYDPVFSLMISNLHFLP
jgi:hypothetical protein